VALSLIALFLAATAPEPPPPRILDEKELVDRTGTDQVRLSLPTQADFDAWRSPGLRLQLGYGYGLQHGWGPAPSFNSHSVTLRPSVRLDDRWALGVALLYGTGPVGARWSVTAEPTFYLWRELALTVGLGYGGLVVVNPRPVVDAGRSPAEVVSRDLRDDEALSSCAGSALSAVARLDHIFVVGPLFATGPFLQGNAQWTRCHESPGLGTVDNETGRPVVLSQWWRQAGLTFGWWLAWR
jgi:hypothetical protein